MKKNSNLFILILSNLFFINFYPPINTIFLYLSSGLINNTKMLHNQNNRNNQSNEKLYFF